MPTTSQMEDGDIAGPFTIALAAEKTVDEKTSQIVVTGSYGDVYRFC